MALSGQERQLTYAAHGHILTNNGVWSRDGQWIVYDVRSDAAGSVFDGTRIERAHVESGDVEVLYQSQQGACCGVATWSPVADAVVFILGPEQPTADWQYAPHHRRGVIVHAAQPGAIENLDACDLTPPFTPGALRGGTHLHTFSGDGQWVAFTYEDHVLAALGDKPGADRNQRNIGVSVRRTGPVQVSRGHSRNHDGQWFSVLVTKTASSPRPGSDEISRACEEAWIGAAGYMNAQGTRQRALAFQGTVVGPNGQSFAEVFVVDLPEDITVAGESGPLEGTTTHRPQPPRGVVQRRLTFTQDRRYPGLAGPRHWLQSSPDSSQIALLMRDDAGVVQLWTISPLGGQPRQVTSNPWDIASAFTWSPDGRQIAHAMDGSICITAVPTGQTSRLTPPNDDLNSPRPEACVFSPDGSRIAYVKTMAGRNQLFVVGVGSLFGP